MQQLSLRFKKRMELQRSRRRQMKSKLLRKRLLLARKRLRRLRRRSRQLKIQKKQRKQKKTRTQLLPQKRLRKIKRLPQRKRLLMLPRVHKMLLKVPLMLQRVRSQRHQQFHQFHLPLRYLRSALLRSIALMRPKRRLRQPKVLKMSWTPRKKISRPWKRIWKQKRRISKS